MILNKKELTKEQRQACINYVYDIVGAAIQVRKELPSSLPEYIYQEAFMKILESMQLSPQKEYIHHPEFRGEPLQSYLRLDFMIPRQDGNIIVEAKAIEALSSKERSQLFSYMIATSFPFGILVNFATYPLPQIERYYFDRTDMTLTAF